ncbi:MAG: hypothetical protein AB7O52_02835 [Planctomycetota bacterium]
MAHQETVSPEQDHDDPDAFDTLYVGLVGTFIVVAAVAVFSGIWFWIDGTAAARAAVEPNAVLVTLRAEQAANVNRSGRVTRPDGEERKAVPIDEAMRQVARELQGGR